MIWMNVGVKYVFCKFTSSIVNNLLRNYYSDLFCYDDEWNLKYSKSKAAIHEKSAPEPKETFALK